MANYSTSADIVLSVNGKQAQKMLATLEKDAQRLEKQIAKAATAGDKASMKKLQRELNNTNKLIQQMRGSAATAEAVLGSLDKATPKELNKTLKQLQQQLNGIERGSEAWNKHVEKIRAVKAELQRVNATMTTQRSLWDRFNGWLNNCQTAIMGVAAAVTGLVMAGRKAVNAYAEMDEQLANTRKYTGMTADDVLKLNDAFLKMDTRTPRDKLNELAQEAGRLGKNTLESVKGYVEAADIINVALVDLGAGATQTIAKLTNIFGVDRMLGTRDAMLSVGSTVNVLSQNCTASKPYLVEFAQRMAGIGSQAGLTIPQILAFGAVLDANGQKVEMSATAIQKVIMNLANKNKEFARTLSLDAEKLNSTLKRSAKDGLLMFLDALHDIGESAGYDNATMSLAPAFKDMGLDAARVSQVLSTLAKHIDEVRWQIGNADKAFQEASSATSEYIIFNNTAQAAIDKARKRVNELAIELGEKLYPVMKHIYTSSGIFLRVLNQIVTFFIKYRSEILTLTAAIVGYNIAVATYNARTTIAATTTKVFTAALNLAKGVVPAVRLVLTALINAVQYFTNGLNVNYAMQERWRKSMAAMKLTSWVGLITAVATAVYMLAKRWREGTAAQKAFQQAQEDAAAAVADEISKIRYYQGVIENYNLSLTERYNAIKNLKSIMADYNGELDTEGRLINHNADAIDAYIKKLNEKALAAALEDKFKESYKAILNAGQSIVDKFGNSEGAKLFMRELAKGQIGADLKLNRTNGNTAATMYFATSRTMGTEGGLPVTYSLSTPHSLNTLGPEEIRNYNDAIDTFLALSSAIDENRREAIMASEKNAPTPKINKQLYDSNEDYRAQADAITANISLKRAAIAGISTGNGIRGPRRALDLEAVGTSDAYQELENTLIRQLNDKFNAEIEALKNAVKEPTGDGGDFVLPESDKDRKAREAAERRAKIKERKDFKKTLDDVKADWENASTENTMEYSAGLKTWTQFLERKHALEVKYFEDRQDVYERFNLLEDENYAELLKKKAEMQQAWLNRQAAMKVDEAKLSQRVDETQAQMNFYTPGNALYRNEETLNQELFDIRIKYLRKMQAAYNAGSEEHHNYELQIADAERAEQLRRQKLFVQRVQEWTQAYSMQAESTRYQQECNLLQEAFDRKLISQEDYYRVLADLKKKYGEDLLPESAKPAADNKKGQAAAMQREFDKLKQLYKTELISFEQYEQAKDLIARRYEKKRIQRAKSYGSTEANQLIDIYDAFKDFFNNTGDDGDNWANRLAKITAGVFGIMNGFIQQSSELMQTCADIEVAKLEKKYDLEIEMAEGNSFRVAKAEKEKEEAIAAIKAENSRKQFAMQVIMAVAQTAQNAIAAYGAGLQVGGPAGLVLAPIAAALAVAAGALQIANIKKQQELAEVQGYASGGFTPDGRRDEVAGVVHKGEWVASQALVNNPRTRPLLEALDYAQRTNTIGSITAADVSRTITAPAVIAAQPQLPPTIINNPAGVSAPDNTELIDTIRELRARLSEPFVTINTVEGDLGIKRAQDEYNKLMRNKTPKLKR